MNKLAIFMIAGLLSAAPAVALHGDGCTATDASDIAGTVYVHLSSADGLEYYYLESGAKAGLQPGAYNDVWGWDEGADYTLCSTDEQDILVF